MARDNSLTGMLMAPGSTLSMARAALQLAYPDAQERREVLQRCPLPRTLVLSTGHGAASVIDSTVARPGLLASRPPRTGMKPRRIKIRHNRSEAPKEDELPVVEIVHFPSLLVATADEAERAATFKQYLSPEGQPPPIVVVVVPATQEHLEDLSTFSNILRALHSGQSGSPVLLVLTKADKVAAEDAVPLVLHRILAGMDLPARAEEPCLAAFNRIFAVISGPVHKAFPVGALHAHEAETISKLLAAAERPGEVQGLELHMGQEALVKELTLQLERHVLLWLAGEAPAVQQRLTCVALEHSALPDEEPALEDVLAAARAKGDLGAALLGMPAAASLPLKDIAGLSHTTSTTVDTLVHALRDGAYGAKGTVEWALNSSLLRQQLLNSVDGSGVASLAQGVLIGLVSQTFAQPASIDVDDRLAIHRFHGLKTALTCTCVDHVLDMAMEDGFGDYVAQALAATMAAKWHTSGTWQAAMDVALAALDLAAELAVKCVEPLFTAAALQEATGGFTLQECEAAATKRRELGARAAELQRALQGLQELQSTGQARAAAAATTLEAASLAAMDASDASTDSSIEDDWSEGDEQDEQLDEQLRSDSGAAEAAAAAEPEQAETQPTTGAEQAEVQPAAATEQAEVQPAAAQTAAPAAGSQAASEAHEAEVAQPAAEQLVPGPDPAQPEAEAEAEAEAEVEAEAEDGVMVQPATAGSADGLAGSMTGSLADLESNRDLIMRAVQEGMINLSEPSTGSDVDNSSDHGTWQLIGQGSSSSLEEAE